MWIAVTLSLLSSVGCLWLLYWAQYNTTPQSLQGLMNDVTYLLIGVALTLIGGFLAVRRADNVVSWFTLGAGLSLSLAAFTEQYANLAVLDTGIWPAETLTLWLSQWLWMLPYVALILLLLFYPTGRLLSPRWRWVLGISLLGYLTLGIMLAFGATLVAGPTGEIGVPNPVGLFPAAGELIFLFSTAILLATLIAALLALGLRFRRARGVEREQMKWLLFAGTLFIAVTIPEFLSVSWSGVISNLIALGIPLAIAVAILRYNLFDIDVVIRRTTSYAVVTLLLAVVYFGSVILLQRLLSPLTGESTAAVVLSTLLIAALFLPVRRRVQDAIDRRFFRRRYDAQKTLEAFAATVRNETDLDALTAELLRVIQETMEPESLSIWLREPTAERWVAGEHKRGAMSE